VRSGCANGFVWSVTDLLFGYPIIFWTTAEVGSSSHTSPESPLKSDDIGLARGGGRRGTETRTS